MGAVAKSYLTNGLLINGEIFAHFLIYNPHQNDQGRKGPCCFQRHIVLKCLKCQKI